METKNEEVNLKHDEAIENSASGTLQLPGPGACPVDIFDFYLLCGVCRDPILSIYMHSLLQTSNVITQNKLQKAQAQVKHIQ